MTRDVTKLINLLLDFCPASQGIGIHRRGERYIVYLSGESTIGGDTIEEALEAARLRLLTRLQNEASSLVNDLCATRANIEKLQSV